jgi:hypothetical protein
VPGEKCLPTPEIRGWGTSVHLYEATRQRIHELLWQTTAFLPHSIPSPLFLSVHGTVLACPKDPWTAENDARCSDDARSWSSTHG